MRDTRTCFSSFTAAVFCCFVLAGCGERDSGGELVMFCAAGMTGPVTRLAAQYEEEKGVPVRLQFGGSGTLLSNLQLAPGDIFLAADASYMDEAERRGLTGETFTVAEMRAGLGVRAGNPENLSSVNDIKRKGIRAAIGNAESAAIGRLTKSVMIRHGLWGGFEPVAEFSTVSELANAIKLGTVDAVILWDAVAHQYPEIDFVSLPEFDDEWKTVTVAVTQGAKSPEKARDFCLYLSDPATGGVVFGEEGYKVSGDARHER